MSARVETSGCEPTAELRQLHAAHFCRQHQSSGATRADCHLQQRSCKRRRGLALLLRTPHLGSRTVQLVLAVQSKPPAHSRCPPLAGSVMQRVEDEARARPATAFCLEQENHSAFLSCSNPPLTISDRTAQSRPDLVAAASCPALVEPGIRNRNREIVGAAISSLLSAGRALSPIVP